MRAFHVTISVVSVAAIGLITACSSYTVRAIQVPDVVAQPVEAVTVNTNGITQPVSSAVDALASPVVQNAAPTQEPTASQPAASTQAAQSQPTTVQTPRQSTASQVTAASHTASTGVTDMSPTVYKTKQISPETAVTLYKYAAAAAAAGFIMYALTTLPRPSLPKAPRRIGTLLRLKAGQ